MQQLADGQNAIKAQSWKDTWLCENTTNLWCILDDESPDDAYSTKLLWNHTGKCQKDDEHTVSGSNTICLLE